MPGLAGCLVCGSDRWVVLPEVGPQSMASDWRVLAMPLRKRMCPDCGLVSSLAPPPPGLFEGKYSLYAHAPSAGPGEHRRQQLYARWIVHARERAGQSTTPQSVLDVGCGNASLLLALGERMAVDNVARMRPVSRGGRTRQRRRLQGLAGQVLEPPDPPPGRSRRQRECHRACGRPLGVSAGSEERVDS